MRIFVLKGQCHKICDQFFLYKNISTLVPVCIFKYPAWPISSKKFWPYKGIRSLFIRHQLKKKNVQEKSEEKRLLPNNNHSVELDYSETHFTSFTVEYLHHISCKIVHHCFSRVRGIRGFRRKRIIREGFGAVKMFEFWNIISP